MNETTRDASFTHWFTALTSHSSPHPWQYQLADEATCGDRLIRVATGLGKTEGVLSAWSFHRIHREDDRWPRRLVWCLPMRTLVEQTVEVAKALTLQMPEAQRPDVYVVMGGEDIDEWFIRPERPAILVGTQDMLLSRALNRGYASPRARWPMEFGLLNHDALWVMDEVQLMDVGLATSAQLQAFREEDRQKQLRPCHTWWMSATLQPKWLHSVDTAAYHDDWVRAPCTVDPAQRSGGLWEISKSLATESPDNSDADTERFANCILEEHAKVPAGEFGRITLVICNTVDRACQTFDALRASGRVEGLELVHGRFRPAEREGWRRRFLSRSACMPEADRIIVATQVVEAGVDISASCLITELAPWPSLVQRFGRCARYSGSGWVLVVDHRRDEINSAPYQPEELASAWEALNKLQDIGIFALEEFEESLTPETRAQLFPYSPSRLLLRKEFDELFDTTPDLTGADLDISRFIRSGDDRDLQVFWIDIKNDKKDEKPKKPPEDYKPRREELCSVPFLKAREWLCEKGRSKLKSNKRAWIWDWLDGEWKPVTAESMLPGRVVCVSADSGGYTIERGFSANSLIPVSIVETNPVDPDVQSLDESDGQQDGDQLSFSCWKTVACHSTEVVQATREIAQRLGLTPELQGIVELAALWHDWGKAHPAFQNMLFRKRENAQKLRSFHMAKSQKITPSIRARYFAGPNENDERRGFRHELASALGLFAILETYAPTHPALLGPWEQALGQLGTSRPSVQPLASTAPLVQRLLKCTSEEFDLVVYLVASHHGKVRVGLHAAPVDQEYRAKPDDKNGLPIRGIREGDHLPEIALIPGELPVPGVTLTLSPAAIGLSHRTGMSWRERCIGLIDRHGPAALAFLEAVLRAADVRASRLNSKDLALESEASS